MENAPVDFLTNLPYNYTALVPVIAWNEHIDMTANSITNNQHSEPFLRPRLTGKRFETHTIPLDFLSDLSAFRDILVEVAKAEFRNKNPERQRIPRNFTDGIELGLSAIESGSAIPVINLIISGVALLPSHQATTYFESARETVIQAIASVEQGNSISTLLPVKAMAHFNRFGQGLKEGEAIEFCNGSGVVQARYSKDVRERIISESPPLPVREKITARGYVTEADVHKRTWTFMFNDGKKVSAPLENAHLGDICDVLKKYNPDSRNNPRVSLEGTAEIRGIEIHSLVHVESIALLDLLDIGSQLDDFRLLKSGWYDGENGVPFHAQELDWLTATWEWLQPDSVALPYIYPTVSGEIQAEWSFGHHEIVLKIDLKKHHGHWHYMNMESENNDEERTLDLDIPEEWNWLFQRLTNFQEEHV